MSASVCVIFRFFDAQFQPSTFIPQTPPRRHPNPTTLRIQQSDKQTPSRFPVRGGGVLGTVGLSLWAFAMSNLWLTALSDPGIIPRNPSNERAPPPVGEVSAPVRASVRAEWSGSLFRALLRGCIFCACFGFEGSAVKKRNCCCCCCCWCGCWCWCCLWLTLCMMLCFCQPFL